MFVCHACRRRTHALRTGPQELTCSRCGVVGFVEEFNQQVQSPSSDEFAWRRDTSQPFRRNDPFDVMAAILREHEGLTRLTLGGGGNANPSQPRGIGGVTFVSTGPRNEGNIAILGNPDAFFNYLPDAFLSMITSENFDNLINLVMGQTGERGPPPAATSVRENLPWETLTAEAAQKYEECVICREAFRAGERVRRLCLDPTKCPHAYHDECIQEWLQRHNTCPICRFQLQTDDSNFESRRQTLERNLHRSLSSRSTSPRVDQMAPEQAGGLPSLSSQRSSQFSRPDLARESSSEYNRSHHNASPPAIQRPSGSQRIVVNQGNPRTASSAPIIQQHSQSASVSQPRPLRHPALTAPIISTRSVTTQYYQSPSRMAPSPLDPRSVSAHQSHRRSEAIASELRPREPQPYHQSNRQIGATNQQSSREETTRGTYQDMLRNLGRAITRTFL